MSEEAEVFSSNHRTPPFQSGELAFEMRAFMSAKATKSEGTQRFYREKLKLILAWFEEQDINEVQGIKPAHVRQYLVHLAETGHTSAASLPMALRTMGYAWKEPSCRRRSVAFHASLTVLSTSHRV